MTRHFVHRFFICAAALILSSPVMAQEGTAQPEKKLMLVWPDPTPEELAVLPADGCKELDDISPVTPDTTNPDYIAWQRTPDGICYAWYKKRMDEAYVFGDTPPGQQPAYAAEPMEEWEIKARAYRAQIERAPDYMKPAGSYPAPSPGNPTPSVK